MPHEKASADRPARRGGPLPAGRRGGVRAGRATAALLPLLLAGCGGVLDPQGAIGVAEKQILINSMAIMLAIIVPTILATLGFAWWFRAGNARATYRPEWTYSGRVELVVWGVPLLTIMLLGGVTWIGSHELDPARPISSEAPTLEVQVVALDWKWLFIYPDQRVASVNRLVVPAGAPLHLTLTSSGVMNSFFVPQLGSQLYAMSGMASQLYLIADRPGTFRGISAHLSGDGFSDMSFEVRAVPDEQFRAWAAATRGDGPVLDGAGYDELAKQSTKVAPHTFRDVDPALFGRIVSQEIPPAAGPQAGRPHGAPRDVSPTPGPQAGHPAANASHRTDH